MPFDLLSKRILVICGKGGTGKSLLSSALGLLAARRGKKVLVAELGTYGIVPKFFDSPGQTVHPNGLIEITPGLFSFALDPYELIDGFVESTLKLRIVSRRVIASPMYRHFVSIAPGLKELISLATIVRIERGDFPSFPEFDMILLDAPATGHSIGLFKILYDAVELIRGGKLSDQTRTILSTFRDPGKTCFNIITLPEEMPVNESLSLAHTLISDFGYPGGVLFVNSMPALSFSEEEESLILGAAAGGDIPDPQKEGDEADRYIDSLLASSIRRIRRAQLGRHYRGVLAESLPGWAQLEIPFFSHADSPDNLVERISDHLSGEL